MTDGRLMRVHIFGASGSGTTTLGGALHDHCGLRHFDTDDYFWEPSEPPYQRHREASERLRLLQRDIESVDAGWVITGSLVGWGDPLIPQLHVAVWLSLATEDRLRRLHERELRRFGAARLAPGGDMHDEHGLFMEWAASYDSAGLNQRSRALHERWAEALPCPVLRLESTNSVRDLLTAVLAVATGVSG